jgi:hypothetical protein
MAKMTKDISVLDTTVARLRQSEPTIAEADFTAAVITRMASTNELPAWVSNGILLAATALGSAILAWQTPLAVPTSLLNAVTTNLPAVLIASVALTYGGALAAVWTAER